ncbi:putative pit accessory protein [compost metagenome]
MDLTTTMDDVLDGLEATASRFYMYHLTEPDEYIIQFADILRQSAYEIQKAVHLLSQKKLLAIREHTIRLNDLENQGDELLRKCINNLFATVSDPIELIKRKEIYERLETTTDACEHVANRLESIIMRNS